MGAAIHGAVLNELRQRDYAHYLALWLVPPERRDFALALFNLETELRTIPAKVSEPTLGLMRIVWWRDAVAEGATRAHPLLQALRPHLAEPSVLADWVETYDLPFLPEDEKNQRLQLRLGQEDQFLTPAAATFRQFARESPHAGRLMLVIQALKAGIYSRKQS